MDLFSPRKTPYAQRLITVTIVSQSRALGPAHGSVTRYRDIPTDSEQALIWAVAQQHDRLGGNSLLDCVVFNRVTREACAGHVSDDRHSRFNNLAGKR